MKIIIKTVFFLMLLSVAYWLLVVKKENPGKDSDWSVEQSIMPYAEIDEDRVSISNIRNFNYQSVSDFTPSYYDASFDLNKLEKVDFIMVPFSSNPEVAHVFLSFGFSDGRHVAISPEARRKKGEKFSTFKGLLNKYDLMYVIADERDVIGLRANHRQEKVYVYPGNSTPENIRKLFLDMLKRSNSLKENPEYYNTLFNSCSSNLVDHINNITPGKISFDLRIIMPGKSDELALSLGLLKTDLQLEEARKKFMVNDKAREYKDSTNFPQRIRE